jgi:hypothetical protein
VIAHNVIETSTRCDCGTHVCVGINAVGSWFAFCDRCYDGTLDSGPRALVCGHGESPDKALAAWAEHHEDFEPQYSTTSLWRFTVPRSPRDYFISCKGALFPTLAEAHKWADASPHGPAVPIHYGPIALGENVNGR